MAYTDGYKRDIKGTIIFWVRNHYDHSRFFDREISHHEMELANANKIITQHLGAVLERAESETVDTNTLIDEVQDATYEFYCLLIDTIYRALRCEVIISTPTALLDHMIREAEESMSVLNLIKTGDNVSPADASIHESYFWLRQMSDHLIFINHYLDASNYELHDEVNMKIRKFNNLFLQANALRKMIRRPRKEMLPVLENFNQMVIKEAKALEAFKLELDDIIKHCAAVTTSPPDLLEHIAREAHHLWRNLEEQIIL